MVHNLPSSLKGEELLRVCTPDELPEVNEEAPNDAAKNSIDIFGLQERFAHALDIGVGVQDRFSHIFVLGADGSLSADRIKTHLEKVLKYRTGMPAPVDWVYLYNHNDPDRPIAAPLKRGKARNLQKKIFKLLEGLMLHVRHTIQELESERKQLWTAFELLKRKEQKNIVKEMADRGYKATLDINTGDARLDSFPERPEGTEVPASETTHFVFLCQRIREQLRRGMREVAEKEAELISKKIEENVSARIDAVRSANDSAELTRYLDGLKDYCIENYQIFLNGKESEEEENGNPLLSFSRRNPFLPFQVNIVIDNAETEKAPIVCASQVSPRELFGFIRREMAGIFYYTDHTKIYGGLLTDANRGFLILDANDLLSFGIYNWVRLKKILMSGEITFESLSSLMGLDTNDTLFPEPIPLRIRVILYGSRDLMETLSFLDPEFLNIFKMRADLLPVVDRDPEHIALYTNWIREWCKEKTFSVDDSAIARIIEYYGRLADSQEKMLFDFDGVSFLLEEARVYAGEGRITREHIQRALESKFWRSDIVYQFMRERVQDKTLLISVQGLKAGQINGLAVSQHTADTSFGFPMRMTAVASVGKPGIINIHHVSQLAENIFVKADQTVQGVIEARFAQESPLAVKINFSVEQTYGLIDGDSASLAQFFVILSAIGGLPIRQAIAITGSMNLHGEIQPIGGVNEKIEGFFDACSAVGTLTGEQGVIIPWQNKKDLMLRKDVVEAVEAGLFHVWPIETLEAGMTILTGMDFGECEMKVKEKLKQYAENAQKFFNKRD